MVRAKRGVQLKEIESDKDFTSVLGMKETIDRWVTSSNVHCHGRVFRRYDVFVLRRELDPEGEGQRKKGRLKRTWKKQAEEENTNVGLSSKKCILPIKDGVLALIRFQLG